MSNIHNLDFQHEEKIIQLLKSCIDNNDSLFIGKLKATKKNAYRLYKTEIFPIIFEDQPIFGYSLKEKLIGLTCASTKPNEVYDLKESIALGVLTVVDKNYRRQNVGTELRIFMANFLKDIGINKFIYEIHSQNEASIKNSKKIIEKHKAQTNLISTKHEASLNV
jgi:RimJ/RimL family protein N-acetyltransferase